MPTPTFNSGQVVTAAQMNWLLGLSNGSGGHVETGSVTISITAVNTTTPGLVTFQQAFTNPPVVIITPIWSQAAQISASVTNVTGTGFKAWMSASSTTGSITANWIAIGI